MLFRSYYFMSPVMVSVFSTTAKGQIGIISLSCVVWLRNFNHKVAWHFLNTFAFVKYALIHNILSVHW